MHEENHSVKTPQSPTPQSPTPQPPSPNATSSNSDSHHENDRSSPTQAPDTTEPNVCQKAEATVETYVQEDIQVHVHVHVHVAQTLLCHSIYSHEYLTLQEESHLYANQEPSVL